MSRLLPLLIGSALLAGCIPQVQRPVVRVDDVRLGSIGFQGGLLYVSIHVVNPNRFDLEADGLSYEIEFRDDGDSDWFDFADGTYREDIRIPAHDSTRVEIPVEFNYDAVGGAMRALFQRGSFTYRVSGAVALEEPLRRRIPFEKTGLMSFRGSR